MGWLERYLRRRDDARVRLLVLPQGHRLGIPLEHALVEVLVRLEPLRHLSDRRFSPIQLEHLLPRGLELLTQRRLVHFGTFHLVA